MSKYSNLLQKCDSFLKLAQELPISAPGQGIIKELGVIINSLYKVSDGLFQKYRTVELPNASKVLKIFQTIMTRIENIKKTLAIAANNKTKEQFANIVTSLKPDLEMILFNISSGGGVGVVQIAREHLTKDTKSIQDLLTDFSITLASLEKLIK